MLADIALGFSIKKSSYDLHLDSYMKSTYETTNEEYY